MRAEIDISEIADLTKAISEYMLLASHVSQLDPAQRESLDELYKRVLAKSDKGTYVDQVAYGYWKDVNVHLIKQTWGNTSGGWEGIGGSAMSQRYTTIIENQWIGAIFVYYGGQLAYIADAGEKLKPFREVSFRNLPGMMNCSKKLDVFYKKSRR